MNFPASFTDQLGRNIIIQERPKRIVSLVPSQTELLFYLGLKEEVVGITKFCVHPAEMFRTKARIGGTKQFHFDKIAELKPDLIIGNKEENEKAQIEALADLYPVWMSDICNFEDALNMILEVGKLTGKEDESKKLVNSIKEAQKNLNQLITINNNRRVVYLIWKNPFMTVASGTFINNMLKLCGLSNVFAHLERYPEVTKQQIQEAEPDIILLSSEPYPFKEKHVEEFKNLCPHADIKVVDGEMFSWYGNRMLFAPEYFLRLFKN